MASNPKGEPPLVELTRDCTCRGTNSNCCICDGKGVVVRLIRYVPPSSEQPMAVSVSREMGVRQSLPTPSGGHRKGNFLWCTYCGAEYLAADGHPNCSVRARQNESFVRSWNDEVVRSVAKLGVLRSSSAEFWKGGSVESRERKRTSAAVPAPPLDISAQRDMKPSILAESAPRGSEAVAGECPLCGRVKRNLLEHHRAKHPGIMYSGPRLKPTPPPVAKSPPTNMSVGRASKKEAPKPSLSTHATGPAFGRFPLGESPHERARERQRDGSRGYHVARDGGSFGSHPVHDRFDDESGSD